MAPEKSHFGKERVADTPTGMEFPQTPFFASSLSQLSELSTIRQLASISFVDESYERGCQEKSLLPTLRESVMVSLASSLISDGEALLRV